MTKQLNNTIDLMENEEMVDNLELLEGEALIIERNLASMRLDAARLEKAKKKEKEILRYIFEKRGEIKTRDVTKQFNIRIVDILSILNERGIYVLESRDYENLDDNEVKYRKHVRRLTTKEETGHFIATVSWLKVNNKKVTLENLAKSLKYTKAEVEMFMSAFEIDMEYLINMDAVEQQITPLMITEYFGRYSGKAFDLEDLCKKNSINYNDAKFGITQMGYMSMDTPLEKLGKATVDRKKLEKTMRFFRLENRARLIKYFSKASTNTFNYLFKPNNQPVSIAGENLKKVKRCIEEDSSITFEQLQEKTGINTKQLTDILQKRVPSKMIPSNLNSVANNGSLKLLIMQLDREGIKPTYEKVLEYGDYDIKEYNYFALYTAVFVPHEILNKKEVEKVLSQLKPEDSITVAYALISINFGISITKSREYMCGPDAPNLTKFDVKFPRSFTVNKVLTYYKEYLNLNIDHMYMYFKKEFPIQVISPVVIRFKKLGLEQIDKVGRFGK